MNALSLLIYIGTYGGRVSLVGDRIHVDIDPRYVTPELREAVARCKTELQVMLSSEERS